MKVVMTWVILTILAILSTPAIADLTDGLIMYVPYDEWYGHTSYDLSGNGFDGTIFHNKYGSEGQGRWSQPGFGDPLTWGVGEAKFGLGCFKANYHPGGAGRPSLIDPHLIIEQDFDPNNFYDVNDLTISMWIRHPLDSDCNDLRVSSSWVNVWRLQSLSFDPVNMKPHTYTAGDEYTVNWWEWASQTAPFPHLEGDALHTRFSSNSENEDDLKLWTGFSSSGAWNRHDLTGAFSDANDFMSDGQWHHVAIVYRGDRFDNDQDPNTGFYLRQEVDVYVDGVQYSREEEYGDGYGHLEIEAILIGGQQEIKGIATENYFDDVAVWARGLTPTEIASIAASTDPLMPAQPARDIPPLPNEPNLIAWYHFEEGTAATVTDDLTLSYPPADGTIVNGPAVSDVNDTLPYPTNPLGLVAPEVGYVLNSVDPDANDITPNSPYVDCGNDAKFDSTVLEKGFTFAAWINMTEDHNDGKWGTLMTKGGVDGTMVIAVEDNGIFAFLNSDQPGHNGEVRTTNDIIPANTWTHVALVYNADLSQDQVSVYVNGNKQFLPDPTPDGPEFAPIHDIVPPLRTSTRSLRIGTAGDHFDDPEVPGEPWWGRAFRGMIDDVRLYNIPLTDAQVFALQFRQCVPRMVGDLDDNCDLNLLDFAQLGLDWLGTYDFDDLVNLAEYWTEEDAYFPVY